jgi:type I restriction enzyme S subunit
MKSSYKRIGDYIQLVDERNRGLVVQELLGLSISKQFISSVANTIGSDMENYKIIRRNQFACSTMQVRRDKKMPVALLRDKEEAIISQAYPVFEVKDESKLLPDYLMMWFERSEFDREACFHAVGGVRGSLEWEDFEEMKLPIPHIDKQREIVKEYNAIQNRIALNEQMIKKLEETAQAIYREWFVEFEFPDENGKPYKSNGGEMVWCEEVGKEIPKGWSLGKLADLVSKNFPISYGVVQPGEEIENGVKFIRSGDLRDGEILFSQLRTISENVSNQFKRTKLEGGEILISIVGNPGQVAIVPNFLKNANIARQVALVKIENLDFQLFLKNQLVSGEGKKKLRDMTIGSVQEVINLEDLRLLKIIIPESSVLIAYNRISKAIETNLQFILIQIQKLLELKELLLSKLAKI